jgi:hypothetical protein
MREYAQMMAGYERVANGEEFYKTNCPSADLESAPRGVGQDLQNEFDRRNRLSYLLQNELRRLRS